jgi:probable phosphoglycerate mutase
VYIFCDGSTGALDRLAADRGNAAGADASDRRRLNGRCAAAAAALSADGNILAIEWQVLPAVTNNEAEYAGLLLGIEIARRLRAHETVFVLDSETVVCQMTGRCGVNSPRLKSWHVRACAAVRGLSGVRYQAIPREYNRLADGAACQAAIAWDEIMRALGDAQGGR